jgi:hypothetical protein
VTPCGVVQVVVTGVAVVISPVRFVICGETVRADVLLDGAMAAVVKSGIGVEKLTNHSPMSSVSPPAVYIENVINLKYV